MNSIVKAGIDDCMLLSDMAKKTFVESHGDSGPEVDITFYIDQKYSFEALANELKDPHNIYHIIYRDAVPAGYSKIIFNSSFAGSGTNNITKLERLYLLKAFYGSTLGAELFDFNLQLSKGSGQSGMWLFVWSANERAIRFYQKMGFVIIGSSDFKISETHYNPNYQMLLNYQVIHSSSERLE